MKKVFIKHNKQLKGFNEDDILFIKSNGDYVTIHTLNKQYTILSTLKSLLEKLSDCFLKVHNSTIINLNNIQLIEDNLAYLINGDFVVISRSKSEELKNKLTIL